MKKLFSFLLKLIHVITLLGVVFYCIGYFFFSKTQRIKSLFTKKSPDTDE